MSLEDRKQNTYYNKILLILGWIKEESSHTNNSTNGIWAYMCRMNQSGTGSLINNFYLFSVILLNILTEKSLKYWLSADCHKKTKDWPLCCVNSVIVL